MRTFWRVLARFVALAIVGCSLTPDRIAFNSLQTIKASAESAIRVTAALKNAGEITDAQWDAAVALYDKIQLASKTAAAGLATVKTAADAELFAADAKVLLKQLQALVASFQVKSGWCFPSHGGVVWAAS